MFLLLESIEISNPDTLKESNDEERDVGTEVIKNCEDVVAGTVSKDQGEKAASAAYQAWKV